MSENADLNPLQARIDKIFSIVNSTQKKLEQEIKELGKSVDAQSQSVNNRGKTIFDENLMKISKSTEDFKNQLEESLNNYQSNNSEELHGLKESLDGQLDSLRGYANQLVEDEELKLVTALETSLTNVTDITKDKSVELNKIITQVTDIADKSTNSPMKIVKDANIKVKDELTVSLRLEHDILAKALIELKNEFRDNISSQIEKVFLGVTLTKESINGIIRDTLSRLEENLNRLNDGIDENFTNEIGVTQDLIHKYEGKLIEAIDQTQQNYNIHMEEILQKHSEKTLDALDELNGQLSSQKQTILEEINGLTESQEELVNHAISQLKGLIVQSKAEVIESHGVLKDDLDKLLRSNSDTIKQAMKNLQNSNQETIAQLVNSISKNSSDQISTLTENSKSTRKELEQSFDQFKKLASQSITQSQQQIKEFGSSIKQERSS